RFCSSVGGGGLRRRIYSRLRPHCKPWRPRARPYDSPGITGPADAHFRKPDSGPARGTFAAARHQRPVGAQPVRGRYVAKPLGALCQAVPDLELSGLEKGIPTACAPELPSHVRFSNRPSGVKRFQGYPPTPVSMSLTGSRFSSDSAPRALPTWDSKTRWNNLSGDLAVNVTAGSSGHTNSPHPSSREGH